MKCNRNFFYFCAVCEHAIQEMDFISMKSRIEFSFFKRQALGKCLYARKLQPGSCIGDRNVQNQSDKHIAPTAYDFPVPFPLMRDRKSTRLNSSHSSISYA